METQRRGLLQRGVEEEVDVVVLIVDEAEGRDAPGFEPQEAHHAFGRSEAKLAAGGKALGLQPCFESRLEVVDIEVVVAMEAHQIVAVALMVAQEDVLAMDAAIVAPPTLGLLDGLALGMVVAGVRYRMLAQESEDGLLAWII